MKYNTTMAALIKNVIQDLPKNAEIAKNIVDAFNPEQYKEVLRFAEHANGDRPIKPISKAVL